MPTYFHVTSCLNRDSIEEAGLDWRRMGVAGGVAGHATGGRTPEAEGIYLCRDEFEVEWFAEMAIGAGHRMVDVWEVTLPDDAAFVAADDGSGYEYHPDRFRSLRCA